MQDQRTSADVQEPCLHDPCLPGYWGSSLYGVACRLPPPRDFFTFVDAWEQETQFPVDKDDLMTLLRADKIKPILSGKDEFWPAFR